ncbi:recombinase family protein [Streptomyces sp. NPDC044780]|uniref:recombinase family protein n=1 Tax=unclassified Streptomyces TaxID=2593676 RepID=UPI0033D02636
MGSNPPYGRGPRRRTRSTSGSRPTSSRPPGRTSSWPRPASRTRVVVEEDGGTSSRLHPLQRPKFGELLAYARPGDTVHISEMFRLVRGTGHILDVLDVLHHDQVALRIHDGAFSAMDLTAYDGLRAAEAKGSKGGRRPAVPADRLEDVRAAYLEGRSIAALARDDGVSRGAIRTAVADLLPEHTAIEEGAPAPELPVTLDMPGKVADFLST